MKIKISRGFSLLEVLVAGIIFSVALTGFFALFVICRNFTTQIKCRLAASYCASQVAETLKIYVSASSNTPPGAGNAFTNSNFSSIGLNSYENLDGITYNRSYNVTNVTNAPGLKQVSITVNWRKP